MTRIALSSNGNTAFEKLIGHNKEILDHWTALEYSIFKDTSLHDELLEQVRRAIAFEHECEYCMVKAGRPVIDPADRAVGAAVTFAQLFARDHKAISDIHFDMLKQVFSEVEISELCSFIGFITACQKLGNIYKLTEDFQLSRTCSMSDFR